MDLRSGKVTTMAENTEHAQNTTPSTQSGDTTQTLPDINMIQQMMDIMTMKLDKNNAKLDQYQQEISRKLDENNIKIETKLDGLRQEMREEIQTKLVQIEEEIRTEMRQEVNTLVDRGFLELSEQVEQQNKKIDECLKQQNSKIENNSEKIQQIPKNIATASTQIITKKDELYFYGDSRMHPQIFITRLKQNLQNLIHDTPVKQYLQEKLRADAELWYQMVEERFETFEQFEILFLKQYWGEYNQRKVRLNLFNGRYDENEGISRERYTIKKFYNIRYLDPKFTEDEMVRYLARHFHDDIHNVIVTQRINTIDGLIEYLRSIDEYKVGWKKVTPRYNERDNRNNDRQYNYKGQNIAHYYDQGNDNKNYEQNRYNNNVGYNNYNNKQYNYNSKSNQTNTQIDNPTYHNVERKQVRWEDRQAQRNDEPRSHAQVTNTNIQRQNET